MFRANTSSALAPRHLSTLASSTAIVTSDGLGRALLLAPCAPLSVMISGDSSCTGSIGFESLHTVGCRSEDVGTVRSLTSQSRTNWLLIEAESPSGHQLASSTSQDHLIVLSHANCQVWTGESDLGVASLSVVDVVLRLLLVKFRWITGPSLAIWMLLRINPGRHRPIARFAPSTPT